MSKLRTPEQKAKHAANARARRKFWPSQSKEARRERGQRKLAHIKALEAVNPLHPEVVQYRESNRKKYRRHAAKYPEKMKERDAEYKSAHRDEINAKARKRYVENPEKIKEIRQKSLAKHPDTQRKSCAKWKAKNPDYFHAYYQAHKAESLEQSRAYSAKRRAIDPEYKMKLALRGRLATAVKRAKVGKTTDTLSLIGCSMKHFVWYMENKFLPGMTWANHSPKGWHIDHKRPCATFDLTDSEQQRYCFHFSNLQPLWWRDNLAKPRKHFPLMVNSESLGEQPTFATL